MKREVREFREFREFNIEQIKKLWTLDRIVAAGSLKKAALNARVSPSAISQSLSSLEKSVGKKLLVRERGSITPTQDALVLLQSVRPAFEIFEKLNQVKPVPQISWMNFGTYESIAIDILPGLIHELKSRLPNIRLNLRISRSSLLMSLVRKGELCTAVITQMDDLGDFYVKELARDRMGVFVSSRLSGAQTQWRSVVKLGFGVLSPGGAGYPRYMSKFMARLDIGKPLLVSDSFESLRMAAASGSIAAVLPVRVGRRHSDLVEVPAPKGRSSEMGEHKICLISERQCDPAEAEFLAEVLGKIIGRSSE